MKSAVPEQAWNRLFENQSQGWVGGDGAGTIDLGNNRVLWLFGDSLIGRIEGGKYAGGTQMVNNAGAVGQLPEQGMAPDHLDFVWGKNDSKGKATAWLVPDPQSVKPANGYEHAEYPHGWFWPAGGGCTIESDRGAKLVFFLFHVGRTAEDKGVWSFKNIGGAMAIVDNPDRPISSWKIRQLDLPHTIDQEMIKADPELRETTWGMSCLQWADSTNSSPWLYIFGTRLLANSNRQILLARVRPARIEELASWHFFSGSADEPRWSTKLEDASSIGDYGAPEFSVQVLKANGQQKFVMVQSDPTLGGKTYVRVADSILGPWNSGKVIYEVEELEESKNYFAYAAKGHPSLSPPGQLVISYVVNSTNFWEMLGDSSIYRPRFISIAEKDVLDDEGVIRD